MANTMEELRPGQRGVVDRLRMPEGEARELLRLGLAPGTRVVCLRRCPLGGPAVYRLRGIDLALRRRDAARISLLQERTDPEQG